MTRSTSPFLSPGRAEAAGNPLERGDWGEPHGLTRGERIGGYEIERAIGAGSAGVVYLVRAPLFGETVALKVLRTELAADDEIEQAWVRRARTAAQINSSHVAAIYEVMRESRPRRSCMVMEYVRGLEILAEHRDRETIVELFAQACEGLSAAHQIGMVHGRLRPDKLLVANGTPPRLELIGFDSIREVRLELGARSASLGSPAYMSPEQIRGEDVDERTDLWSLGVIMYEALSGGHLPFDAPTLMGIAARVLAQPSPSLLEFGVPADLVNIVDRCLAKDRGDRYASASQLARALRSANQHSFGDDESMNWWSSLRLRPGPERSSRPRGWLRRIAQVFGHDPIDDVSRAPDEDRDFEDSKRSDELIAQSYLAAIVRSFDDSRLLLDRLIDSSSRLRDRMAVSVERSANLGE